MRKGKELNKSIGRGARASTTGPLGKLTMRQRSLMVGLKRKDEETEK